MRKFSRWMPLLKQLKQRPFSFLEWCLSVVFGLVGLVAYLAMWVVMAVICVVASPILIFEYLFCKRETRDLVAERAGEDIGTFARTFDRRNEPFDPWVIRATWDELMPWLGVALRATDEIIGDLGITDPLEVDVTIEDIAERSMHSLENVEKNPNWGKVKTVGDLVRLITSQPRIDPKFRS